MPRQHEITQPGRRGEQRGREADRTLTKGFRPLGLPAVAAAANAGSRGREDRLPRPESQGEARKHRDS
jgi:hypothetical protein